MQQIIILFLLLLIVLILSVGIIYPLIFGRKNKNFTPSQAMKTVGILFVLIIIL
jgi:flagellar basal body-associated protein FliL